MLHRIACECMASADWYLHKADQCDRLAAEAADPHRRVTLKEEAARWREIAAAIARQEGSETLAAGQFDFLFRHPHPGRLTKRTEPSAARCWDKASFCSTLSPLSPGGLSRPLGLLFAPPELAASSFQRRCFTLQPSPQTLEVAARELTCVNAVSHGFGR